MPAPVETKTSGDGDHAEANAFVAARELYQQTGASHIGFLRTRGSGATTTESGHRVVLESTDEVLSFATPEELTAWFHAYTSDPDTFEYIAAFRATPGGLRMTMSAVPPQPEGTGWIAQRMIRRR